MRPEEAYARVADGPTPSESRAVTALCSALRRGDYAIRKGEDGKTVSSWEVAVLAAFRQQRAEAVRSAVALFVNVVERGEARVVDLVRGADGDWYVQS